MTIHQDGAVVDIVEAHQQLDHGGLAGAGRTDDGDLLAGFGVEREVVDDDLIRVVTEVDILEIHPPGRWSRTGTESTDIGRFLGFSQELEHTLGRGHGLLEDVGDIGDLGDRLGEGAHVLDESLDIADGDRALDGQVSAQDTDGHIAQVADKVHDREHHARKELGFPGRVVQHVIDLDRIAAMLLASPLKAFTTRWLPYISSTWPLM